MKKGLVDRREFLGPVCKWLDIHHGDRMVFLTSSMSRPAALHAFAVRRFGKESEAAKIDWRCGDMCVTLVKTAGDRLITVYMASMFSSGVSG